MTKFKTNVFKYIIIPAIAILALLCFAPKANAFYLDYNALDSVVEASNGALSYSYNNISTSLGNVNVNIKYQLLEEFPDNFEDGNNYQYNIFYYALFDNSTGNAYFESYDYSFLTRYIELYIEYDGTSFDSSNSLYSHLDSVGLVPDFNNSSNDTYFGNFVNSLYSHYFQSSGYTEEEYQSAIDAAVSEATKDMYTEAELQEILSEARLNRGGYALYPSNVDLSPESFGYYMKSVYGYKAVSGIDASFNYIQISNTSVSDDYIGDEIYLIDPFEFQSFCLAHNITNYSDLESALISIGSSFESGSAEKEWLSNLMTYPMSEGAFDYYYNYKGLTQEEYDASIDEAKAGAVEEYKNSDDYTSTINLAKTAGVEEYKKSDSYASVLTTRYNNGYSEGLAAGELSYKTSSENKAALKGEYNKGFDTGFVEGQKKVNVGPVIAGVCILAIVALALVIVTRKKKNKFRR